MASSGSFTTTACEGRSLTFSWSIQSQSIANNTTTISWNLKGSGSYTGYVMCGGFNVVINGVTVCNNSTDYRIEVWPGTVVASGTHTISHNSDGTKSFSASAKAGIFTYAVNCSGSGTWALTTIPRASTITSASNITLGNNCGITWTPASTDFQYDIFFTLGSWRVSTGKIAPKTTSAYTYNYYQIPANYDTLSQIPYSTTGTMTATLTTYNSSGTQIGSTSSKTFTVTVPNTVVPTVGTITLTPQTYSYLIQNKNTVNVAVSGCSAGTGSSIKSYTFLGPGISTTTTSTSVVSSIISNTGTLTYRVTVIDSRGRTASKTATIYCYPHFLPRITSLNAFRCNENGQADKNGLKIKCSFTLTYALVNNTNKCSVNIYGKTGDGNYKSIRTASGLSNDSGTIGVSLLVNGTFDLNSKHTLYVTATDGYGGSGKSETFILFGASKILNITSDGTGIAFGKMAESEEMLDSRWPIKTDAPEQTMQNLSYRGTNLISSTDKDTVANWNNQGNLATTFYTETGKLTNQPSQYGFLLNLSAGIGGKEMHNLWFQQPNGDVSHRGGNGDGLGGWRKFLDSSNYTSWVSTKPTTLYSTSTGNIGTITLSESAANFTYLEIFYTDNNSRQPNSVKIYSPNGKYVSLSCIEPSTSGSEPRVYIRSSGWTISGASMIVGRSDLSGVNAGVYGQMYPHANGTNIDVKVTANNYIKIFRILGYK